MPYNPMKKHMDKLDEWGASQAKKLGAQREAGSSTSMSDRLNLARGRDNRWESSKKTSGDADEDPDNIVPARSARLPPPPTLATRSNAAPPPPPQRTGSGVGVPPPPARSATTASRPPPPVLPRRMDNDNGTPNPPPPYPAGAPSPPVRNAGANTGLLEFSKFTEEDKQGFFSLLDEYFAARRNANGKSSKRSTLTESRRSTDPVASSSAAQPSPLKVSSTETPAPKPSGPGAKPSVNMDERGGRREAPAKKTAAQWQYPLLSASQRPHGDVCKALECASFLVYRDSYPEWSASQPWFSKKNAIPTSLQGRRDIAWSSSSMYRGAEHTLMGASLFDDLSCLWWRISWNASNAAGSARVEVAYKDTPQAWNDEGRLQEAARGFGDWTAGFAEQAERDKSPVGDGECWTLAAEAIRYTNDTAQLTPDNRLLASIGRTHGHLIYAAKADPIKGQCGRWRGGDRIREHWGGIRRGDIIEWRTARCSELNAARGSYVTLGAPEHTAIVVEDSPVPERLTRSTTSSRSSDFYSLLQIKASATQAEIRGAYLTAARRYHPDRQKGHLATTDNGPSMEALNEAHETLSDPARRSAYDEARQSGMLGSSGQSNTTRVSAQVDLDSMELCQQMEGDKLTFFHPCRCGSGFYVDEEQLERSSKPVVQCSGCSERIRIISGQDSIGDGEEGADAGEEEMEEQPVLDPWELGSITTIEQSAGQVPTRRTYSLAKDSFTSGELWIYRPVWEKEYVGGAVQAGWPPSVPGWQAL